MSVANPKHDSMRVGDRHGELTALDQIDGRWWMFRCSCGKRKRIDAGRVLSGIIATCGDRKMHHPRTKSARNPEEDRE